MEGGNGKGVQKMMRIASNVEGPSQNALVACKCMCALVCLAVCVCVC